MFRISYEFSSMKPAKGIPGIAILLVRRIIIAKKGPIIDNFHNFHDAYLTPVTSVHPVLV